MNDAVGAKTDVGRMRRQACKPRLAGPPTAPTQPPGVNRDAQRGASFVGLRAGWRALPDSCLVSIT